MFTDHHIQTIGEVLEFLKGTNSVEFRSTKRSERAAWARTVLMRFKYLCLKRMEKGIVQRYIRKITGYSHAQTARHIAAYRGGRPIGSRYRRHRFAQIYTEADVELLVETDNLHERLNGAATKKICEMMYLAGDKRFERLRYISIAHLYNLRKKKRYILRALTYEKTKPTAVAIGERRKPVPFGKPGYIRVDTVHQGDLEAEKGVYHINLVDEVTQWEVVAAVSEISESFLIPILEEALIQFPFKLLNFHSDNGSEYINYTVAKLLQKLLICQTKSRPRHSNDNGLVETKNGSIIRKHMGYHYVPQRYATRINQFYRNFFIPYLNFHRPCGFPKQMIFPNGRRKTIYPLENYMTPFQKFLSFQDAEKFLRKDMTMEHLKILAAEKTPHEAAGAMQQAKRRMMTIIVSSATILSTNHPKQKN